jgi:hypothetical protein
MSEAMVNSFVEVDGASTQIKWTPNIWYWGICSPKMRHRRTFAGRGNRTWNQAALPTFTGTIAQMLRPFPQYNAVADVYGDVGQSNYNALQLSIQQRLYRGLTFNFNYTYSKAIGTINGNRSAYIQEKHLSTTDQPHLVNTFYAYDLPFGKNRTYDPDNSVVRALVSGWQVSGITRYSTGAPLGPFTANCKCLRLARAGQASIQTSGPVRINGDWGDGNVLGPVGGATPFIDVNAFTSPAAFTYGNTPATGAAGLRNPHFFNQDLSVTRNFQITETLKFVFGCDGFNIFNNVRFGSIKTNITNAGFVKVGSQVNLPRVFQFKLRLDF